MGLSFAGPVAAAEHLAAELLGDLRTALGGLHVDHARRVADAVRDGGDEVTVAAALLHDVVEKGCIAEDDLERLVADPRITGLVGILTRHAGESDRTYLVRCCATPESLVIKRADLADKICAGDARVPPAEAARLRRRAARRLALLDELAGLAPAVP